MTLDGLIFSYSENDSAEVNREAILAEFADRFLRNVKDLDPEIEQAISRHFWDMYEPFYL